MQRRKINLFLYLQITPQIEATIEISPPATAAVAGGVGETSLASLPIIETLNVDTPLSSKYPSKVSGGKSSQHRDRLAKSRAIKAKPEDHVPIAEQPPPVIRYEEPMEVELGDNILDAAMEECGIVQDMQLLATPKKQEQPLLAVVPEASPPPPPPPPHVLEDQVTQKELPSPPKTNVDLKYLLASPPSTSLSKTTRKTKQQRESELTMQLLETEKPDEEAVRMEHEALEIIMNAKEELDAEKLSKVYQILANDAMNNVTKFTEVHRLCTGKMDLQEMLLDMLTASDAMSLGLKVYQQYCIRDAMKKFFRKVRIYFANQPSTHTKILKEVQASLSDPNVKLEDVVAIGTKWFKSNQHLLDDYMSFVTGVPYPEGMLPEPEVIDLSDEEEEESMLEEKINLLEDESEFGGDNCPCACHPAPNTGHCIHCSLRFINGKVYSRDGKILRPVKVNYPPGESPFSNKKKEKKRKKKRSSYVKQIKHE